MTTPIDTCRLYLRLRDLARPERADDAPCRLVDVDHDHAAANDLGLSPQQIDDALAELEDADLIHRLTPSEEQDRHVEHPPGHHDVLTVTSMDDLSAAALLIASS